MTDRANYLNFGFVPGQIAVESDWPVFGLGGCQGKNAAGTKCSMQHKHTGTLHRFCIRPGHEGNCTMLCYIDLGSL